MCDAIWEPKLCLAALPYGPLMSQFDSSQNYCEASLRAGPSGRIFKKMFFDGNIVSSKWVRR